MNYEMNILSFWVRVDFYVKEKRHRTLNFPLGKVSFTYVEKHTKFVSENLKWKDQMEHLWVDGKIILEYIWINMMQNCGLDWSVFG
jgi:hypothetical protein